LLSLTNALNSSSTALPAARARSGVSCVGSPRAGPASQIRAPRAARAADMVRGADWGARGGTARGGEARGSPDGVCDVEVAQLRPERVALVERLRPAWRASAAQGCSFSGADVQPDMNTFHRK